jgi:hypothetical protein
MRRNISPVEQGISVALGALMLVPALKRRSSASGRLFRAATAALSAGLLSRGTTGHCALYEKIGLDTAGTPHKAADHERAVLVNLPRAEVEAALASATLPRLSLSPANVRLADAHDGKRTRMEATSHSKDSWTDLWKLKSFLEAGEIPTVEGQSTGHRSLVGKSISTVLPSARENAVHVGPEPLKVKPPRRLRDGTLEVRA